MQYEDVRRELLRQWTYTGGPKEAKAAELYHDDAVLEFPQSGERFTGTPTSRAGASATRPGSTSSPASSAATSQPPSTAELNRGSFAPLDSGIVATWPTRMCSPSPRRGEGSGWHR
jgi:hypothetical protein